MHLLLSYNRIKIIGIILPLKLKRKSKRNHGYSWMYKYWTRLAEFPIMVTISYWQNVKSVSMNC